MESKRKTIPCKFFFEAGFCRKDQECDFSHDPSTQQNNQGGQSNRGAFGFSRGGGRGGGGRFGRGGGRGSSGRGGSHSNYHDDPSGANSGGPQQNNYYGNSRGREPYRARPDYQYQSKPKTDYGEKPPSNDKGKMSCKYFRMGTCNSGVNCKFLHTWTDNDDLGLAYLRSFGDENVKTDDFEIRDVCIIDSSKKIVAFAQPKSILFVDFNSNSNENQEKMMDEAEELTCMRYFENALFVGIFNTNKNCSIIKVIQFDGSEMTIEPAHQDYIVDICNIRDFIITASLDTKIKFWKMNQIALKFEVVFTQNHKEMSKMKNITYNGIDSLFVANNDFSLSIYSIDYSIAPLNMNMIANYDNYHGDIITNLKFFSSNQQTHLVTSSFDRTIKFFSLDDGKAFQKQFELPISSMDIVKNNKDKDILAIGCANGNVELYDLNNNFQDMGKLILHKQRIVSNLVGFSERINDVGFNYMIVSDTGGRASVWKFQKERK